jgi:50S ribosomal protein L16 3-hydroxylase
MLDDLTTELISKGDSNDVLTDPLLTPKMATQPISSEYLKQIRSLLNQTLDDDELLLNWFAQFMTQPKYPELVDETGERRSTYICNPTGANTKYYNGLLTTQYNDKN